MKAELVPENGDPPIPITRDVTVIGRREFCDVRINHQSLSKRHAVVVKTDGLLVIRDLATTNGTKVKGQRIRWAALLPDDRLTLGGYKMRVYLGPDDAPAPSERYSAAPAYPSASSGTGFATPSPVQGVPVVPSSADDLELVAEVDDGSGSEWRHLIAARPNPADAPVHLDDVIIELD
ncbi:MAG: FHA domain-containing protein [Isosphaeraceae bacterium]